MLEITKADAESTKSKFAMSKEVEELTAKLFQEANEMVSEARQNAETEIGKAKQEAQSEQDKNHRLQAQLTDTETLLANHQAQLAEITAAQRTTQGELASERETNAALKVANDKNIVDLKKKMAHEFSALQSFHTQLTANNEARHQEAANAIRT